MQKFIHPFELHFAQKLYQIYYSFIVQFPKGKLMSLVSYAYEKEYAVLIGYFSDHFLRKSGKVIYGPYPMQFLNLDSCRPFWYKIPAHNNK